MSLKVKKHYFSRILVTAAYILALGVYLFIGFQPRAEVEAGSDDRLSIPSINLLTPVKNISREGNTLTAPETIPGAYSESLHKTLLIGHSSTIFKDLKNVQLGDELTFDNIKYRVTELETLEKSEIDMRAVVANTAEDTIILMTCAGEPLGGSDYTHRLIITAVKR